MEDQNYILFEAYLSNELSKDEVADFKNKLKNDDEFSQAFQAYKELSSFLEHKFENEETSKAFEDNLRKISTEHFDKESTASESQGNVKSFNFYKYAIAACVVLLFGLFVFNKFSTPTYSDYNNYGAISLSVRGDNSALLKKRAETAFNNKKFAEADAAFKSLLESDSSNSELNLYRAISNLELNHFETAEDLLKDLRNGNSAYKNKATWYLALSKLKQKQNDACLEILKTIPEGADDYKRAKKLINKLD